MKNLVVIFLLLIFSATQFASLLSNISAPLIHAICYGQVFKRRSACPGNQFLLMDSTTFRQSRTDDHEILIGGELFDIVAIAHQGDSIHIEVNNDEFETHFFNIVKQIRGAVNKASGPRQHNKQLQSWLLKLYCRDEISANLNLPRPISARYKIACIPLLQKGIDNPHIQPPDLFA